MAGRVIVGAGECGARAALALRGRGFDGPIHLVGEEAELPYERPPLSKAVLAEDGAPPRQVVNEAALAERSITLHRANPAVAIDRDARIVRLADGGALCYDLLLLATGARPRRLQKDGAEIAGIHYLRHMADCRALRQRLGSGAKLLVLGGGFLGLEIAATARRRGCAVTLIETQPRVLMRGVPADIADVVAARHRAAGVDLRCGVGIAGIAADETGAAVTLADGSRLAGDLLVACVGAVPNTELAAAAGLTVDNGIVVDARLRTGDPAIFAVGDCCAFPLSSRDGRVMRLESWRCALEQAEAVAGSMLGEERPFETVPWFWSDQYELSLQVAGLPEPDHAIVERRLADDAFILFHLDATGRLAAASDIGPDGSIARDIRLAEMLIARRARPDPALLSRAEVKLKGLLAA
ncbi:ferredoxin reductase [Devosia geojensis]|uniref:Ferredoxin reductase n=1 Tax=Devosia geojensis TaxID=443610 RepID=A0A0F5FS88_9HYPH|nr:FAD-dependent oxidoreductase [Devosia geojensis]KKB11455.1 ferredoxin reductase [Devosia geojensis]